LSGAAALSSCMLADRLVRQSVSEVVVGLPIHGKNCLVFWKNKGRPLFLFAAHEAIRNSQSPFLPAIGDRAGGRCIGYAGVLWSAEPRRGVAVALRMIPMVACQG